MIIETKLFCRKGYAYTLFGHVVIHPESPSYLIPHEAVHVVQMKRVGYLRWYWRYFTDDAFRLEAEVPAHKAAIASGQPLWLAAQQLWSNYSLQISYSDAIKLLM